MLFLRDWWCQIKNSFKPSPYMFERRLLAKRGFKTLGVYCLSENKYVEITPTRINYYFLLLDRTGLPIGRHRWNNNGPTYVSKNLGTEYQWRYGNTSDFVEITDKVKIWAEARGMDWERLTEEERLQFSLDFSVLK